MDKTMALKPRMSEKAYASSKVISTYVFDVPVTANKLSVADAVNAQFGVTVQNVRISIAKGKAKNSYRKGRRPIAGKRADVKRAYVRIKDGDKINIFEIEEKEEKKAEKAAQKAEKSQAKKPKVSETKQRRSFKQVLTNAPRQTQNRGGEK